MVDQKRTAKNLRLDKMWIAVDLVRMLLSVTLRRVLAQIITAIPTAFSSTRLAIRIHWAAIQLTIFATFTNAAANRKRRRTWTATAVTVLAAKVRLRRTQAFLLWTRKYQIARAP